MQHTPSLSRFRLGRYLHLLTRASFALAVLLAAPSLVHADDGQRNATFLDLASDSEFLSYPRSVEYGDMNYVLVRRDTAQDLVLYSNKDEHDDMTGQVIATEGGLHPGLAVDQTGAVFVSHSAATSDYSGTTDGTGYKSYLVSNKSGSWTSVQLDSGSDHDTWKTSVAVVGDTAYVFAPTVRTSTADSYIYTVDTNTMTVTSTQTVAPSTTCSSIDNAWQSTSAVYNPATSEVSFAYMCTGVGSGQGLYITTLNTTTGTVSDTDYLNTYHTYRAGEMPALYVNNGVTSIAYTVGNNDTLFIAQRSAGSWTTSEVTAAASKALSGSLHSVTVGTTHYLLAAFGGSVYEISAPTGSAASNYELQKLSLWYTDDGELKEYTNLSATGFVGFDNDGELFGFITDDATADAILVQAYTDPNISTTTIGVESTIAPTATQLKAKRFKGGVKAGVTAAYMEAQSIEKIKVTLAVSKKLTGKKFKKVATKTTSARMAKFKRSAYPDLKGAKRVRISVGAYTTDGDWSTITRKVIKL